MSLHIPYDYSPWIYNSLEKAADNLAENYCDRLQMIGQYGVPMVLVGAQILTNWLLHDKAAKKSVAGQAAVVIAPAHQPRGVLGHALHAGYKAIKKVASNPLGKLTIAESISDYAHRNYLNENVWDYQRPVIKAIFRPLAKKIAESHFEIFDEGDLNFQLRDFVIGGENAGGIGGLLTYVNKPLWHIRNKLSGLFVSSSYPTINAPWYYEKSKAATEILFNTITVFKDAMYAMSKTGEVILSGPKRTIEGIKAIWDYIGGLRNTVWEFSAPVRQGLSAWLAWGVEQLRSGFWGGLDGIDHGLEVVANSVSDGIESKTGVRIPAWMIHRTEQAVLTLAAAGAVGVTTYATGVRVKQWVQNAQPGVALVNHVGPFLNLFGYQQPPQQGGGVAPINGAAAQNGAPVANPLAP